MWGEIADVAMRNDVCFIFIAYISPTGSIRRLKYKVQQQL
jgi:hypothetical protein